MDKDIVVGVLVSATKNVDPLLSSLLTQRKLPKTIVLSDQTPGQNLLTPNMGLWHAIARDFGVLLLVARGELSPSMVEARIAVESLMSKFPAWGYAMFDDDHWYPPGYLAEAQRRLCHYDIAGAEVFSTTVDFPAYGSFRASQYCRRAKEISVREGQTMWCGGTLVYRAGFLGLYSKVSEYTRAYVEDVVWQCLARVHGARVCPKALPTVFHNVNFTRSRYLGGSALIAKFREEILGDTPLIER